MLMQRPLLLLLHGKGMQEQLQQTPGLWHSLDNLPTDMAMTTV